MKEMLTPEALESLNILGEFNYGEDLFKREFREFSQLHRSNYYHGEVKIGTK